MSNSALAKAGLVNRLSILLLALALAFAQTAAGASSPLQDASCTSSFGYFQAERQARIGRGCTYERDLVLPSSSTYTLHRVTTHYDAKGNRSTGAAVVRLTGSPYVAGGVADPSRQLFEDIPVAARPGVSSTSVEREQFFVTDDETGQVVEGATAGKSGAWSVRHVEKLKVAERRSEGNVRKRGRDLFISGEMVAVCASCTRVVGLYANDGQGEISTSGTFKAQDGILKFRLAVPYGLIQNETILELKSEMALDYLGLNRAGKARTYRTPATAAPKTDVKLLVRRVNGTLAATVIRPGTTDAQTTVSFDADRRPVAFLLSSQFQAYEGSKLDLTSCCEVIELVPKYRWQIRNGQAFVTLRWQRLLMPNEGRVEKFYAIYEDGSRVLLQKITARRYAENSRRQTDISVEEGPDPVSAPPMPIYEPAV